MNTYPAKRARVALVLVVLHRRAGAGLAGLRPGRAAARHEGRRHPRAVPGRQPGAARPPGRPDARAGRAGPRRVHPPARAGRHGQRHRRPLRAERHGGLRQPVRDAKPSGRSPSGRSSARSPPPSDPEVRTFLLSQLRLVGRDAAVRPRRRSWPTPRLVEPATQLMLTVKSAPARAALLAALDKATGPGQITIVKALGELKAAEAHDRLLALRERPEPRHAAAGAGRARAPRQPGVRTRPSPRPPSARASGTSRPTRSARCWSTRRTSREKGDLATLREGLPAGHEEDRRSPSACPRGRRRWPSWRTRAGTTRSRICSRPSITPTAPTGTRPCRPPSGSAGIAPIRQWIAKAQKVDAGRRAEIVAMLGRQGDRRALPFIRSSLAAREPEVMLAAAEALAHMEGANANPDLLALLKTRDGRRGEGRGGRPRLDDRRAPSRSARRDARHAAAAGEGRGHRRDRRQGRPPVRRAHPPADLGRQPRDPRGRLRRARGCGRRRRSARAAPLLDGGGRGDGRRRAEGRRGGRQPGSSRERKDRGRCWRH